MRNIASTARRRGTNANRILGIIEATLAGIEIEPDLASLSMSLLSNLLRDEIGIARRKLKVKIRNRGRIRVVSGGPPLRRCHRKSTLWAYLQSLENAS